MATIVKRPGSARPWQVRYRTPDGSQRSAQFRRKVDAERFAIEIEHGKLTSTWIDPSLGKTTFADWAEQWWVTTADLRPSTRTRLRGIIDKYLLPTFGQRTLASVAHIEVRAWVAGLSETGLAPRTVRKIGQTFANILAGAVDARLIAVSPCERVPLPKAEDEEMRFLSPGEVKTLAESMDARYRALVLVAAYGGLRLGELVGLRRRRVDVLRGRVTVAETGVEAGGTVVFGPPKTRAGHRTVTLPRDAQAALVEHVSSFTAPDAEALVFTAPEGGVLRAATFRRRFWQPAVDRAGLSPLRIHDARHTAISLWIAAGDNPKEVSRRAGHTSVAFTLDRYGHLYPDADDRARDRLDALIAQAQPHSGAGVAGLPRSA